MESTQRPPSILRTIVIALTAVPAAFFATWVLWAAVSVTGIFIAVLLSPFAGFFSFLAALALGINFGGRETKFHGIGRVAAVIGALVGVAGLVMIVPYLSNLSCC